MLCILLEAKKDGLMAAKSFFDSYCAHRAGVEHCLYVISKGWRTGAEERALEELAKQFNAIVLRQDDTGFDLGAYFRAVRAVQQPYVLFLNTHSRILGDLWLKKLATGLLRDGVGMIGVSGSLVAGLTGSTCPPFNLSSWVTWPLRLCNNFIKSRFYKQKYDLFPNIHLRSNAFMVSTALFAEFAGRSAFPRKKK